LIFRTILEKRLSRYRGIKGKVKVFRVVTEMAAAPVPLRGLGWSSSMVKEQRPSKTHSLTDKIGSVVILGYRITF